MSVEARIATSHPSAMWREARYWRSAWKVVVAFLAGGIVVVLVTVLAYTQADWKAYAALGFHVLTLAGLIVAMRALAQIEVDEAIATIVEARATQAVREIKGGNRARYGLEQIEEDFLPHNPGHQGGTLGIFRYVLQEARDRKFHPSRALAQPLRERYGGDLHVMHSFQRLALQLGILFTFAGLIVALEPFKKGFSTPSPSAVSESSASDAAAGSDMDSGKASEAGGSAELTTGSVEASGKATAAAEGSTDADGSKSKEQDPILGMFDGLYTAFSTSVAGLEVAAIVGVMLLLLRRRQAIFFEHLDRATSSLISLSRNAINPDFFNAELEQVRGSMEQLNERVWDQSRALEQHTSEVRSGIERLADLKLRFNEFLSGIQGEQSRVLDEMRSVYDIISPKGVAQDMQNGLMAAVGEVTQRVDQDLSNALQRLDGLEPSLARLESLAAKSSEESERRVQDLVAERVGLQTLRGELTESLGEICKLHEETLSRAGTPLDQYRSAVIDGLDRSLSRTTQAVTDRLDRIGRRMDALHQQGEIGTESLRRAVGHRSRGRMAASLQNTARWLVRIGNIEVLPWRRRARGAVPSDPPEEPVTSEDTAEIDVFSKTAEFPEDYEILPGGGEA